MRFLHSICLLMLFLPFHVWGQEVTRNNYMTFDRDSLQSLANSGNPDAMCTLGNVFYFSSEADNQKKAYELWLKAAKKGHFESQFKTGCCYMYGEGTRKNIVEALYWFLRLPYKIEWIFKTYKIEGISKNNVPLIQRQAEVQEDSRAQFVLGAMYIMGFLVDSDIPHGIALLNKSGTVEAYEMLSFLYGNKDWGMKDWNRAIEYYQKGAVLGNCKAMSHLAYCRLNGYVLPQDYNKALTLYLCAYENGVNYDDMHENIGVSIPYLIGTLYEDKKVKNYDPLLAVRYFTEAAERFQDYNAMLKLAQMYYKGINGTTVNYSNAVKWLKRAEESYSNNGEVFQLLSTCYRFGRGVEQNETEAGKYAQTATRLNSTRQDKLRLMELNQPAPQPTKIEMVSVEGGKIRIGATNKQKREAYEYEYPSIEVTVSSFAIGKYEVTQRQWADVMGYNPCKEKGDNLPVTNISWQEIQLFLKRLNAVSEKRYRLPTEAEWEYAARGGQASLDYYYIGGDTLDKVAWLDHSLHAVGQKRPNELGLYDMAGNVWEWCADYLGGYGQYIDDALVNPRGEAQDAAARRGGSSYYFDWGCRPAFRGSAPIGEVRNDTGFRVCLDEE